MPNLRVIHDNAVDRGTVTASSTAAGYPASNLLTDRKVEVHRSTGTSVTYKVTWPSLETVGMMALPSSNASETATVRMRAWDAEVGGSLLADTGTIYAAPGADLGMWDWEMPLNSNAALYGGDVKATAYFADHVAARRVEIEVIDLDNPAGYIDQARLVVGQYWEPEHNAELGSARVSVIDTSKVSRADSGDPVVDRGTLHSALAFDMTWLDPEDRARLAHILRGCGLYRPLFISIYPESEDVLTEQDCMIYGRIKAMPALTHARLGLFASQLEIEGW